VTSDGKTLSVPSHRPKVVGIELPPGPGELHAERLRKEGRARTQIAERTDVSPGVWGKLLSEARGAILRGR
jgi:hypothetical protein